MLSLREAREATEAAACHTHHTNNMQAVVPPPLVQCQLHSVIEREGVREREGEGELSVCIYIYDASSQSRLSSTHLASSRLISAHLSASLLLPFGSQFKKSFQVSCFNKFQVKVFSVRAINFHLV